MLRGPQGTLSGMNSQGGAIKLYSRKPEGEGGSRRGDDRQLRPPVDVEGRAPTSPSVPDAVFARVTGVTRNRDGHRDAATTTLASTRTIPTSFPRAIRRASPRSGDCEVGELGNQQMYAVRGALRIAPAGGPLEINLIGRLHQGHLRHPGVGAHRQRGVREQAGTATPVEPLGNQRPLPGRRL